MTKHILPTDINKNLHSLIVRAEDKHLNKLIDGGTNAISLDKKLFSATTLFTFGSFVGIVAIPTVFAPFMPAIAVAGFAGLIGSAVVGQVHKFLANKGKHDVLKEFMEGTNVKYSKDFADDILDGYHNKFLDRLVTQEHFKATATKEEVVEIVKSASQKAEQSIFTSLKEKISSSVDNLTDKIKNSTKAFLRGYNEAKQELSSKPPAPK